MIDLNLQIFLEFVDVKRVVEPQGGEDGMGVETSGLRTNANGTRR